MGNVFPTLSQDCSSERDAEGIRMNHDIMCTVLKRSPALSAGPPWNNPPPFVSRWFRTSTVCASIQSHVTWQRKRWAPAGWRSDTNNSEASTVLEGVADGSCEKQSFSWKKLCTCPFVYSIDLKLDPANSTLFWKWHFHGLFCHRGIGTYNGFKRFITDFKELNTCPSC